MQLTSVLRYFPVLFPKSREFGRLRRVRADCVRHHPAPKTSGFFLRYRKPRHFRSLARQRRDMPPLDAVIEDRRYPVAAGR
jgi:hypothetical protein